MPRWLIPLLVAAVGLLLPTAGQAAGPGGISGTVAAEGVGLAGVEVCAEERGGVEEFACEETGVGGTYLIDGLPSGQYIVSFTPAIGQNFVRQFYNGAPTAATAVPVTVGFGTTAGIDAVLAKGAKISGTVIAATTGLPVSEAFVCAFSSAGSAGCANTNSAGAYVILGLAAGSYEVEAFPTGGENLTWAGYPGLVTVPAAGEVPGINIALPPGGQIEGTVRLAATGSPLKGVQVCVTEASESWPLACLKTPASGAYRFYGFSTGSYKVVFSPEPTELEESEFWEIAPDPYPTQWWNGQGTFATATPIGIAFSGAVAAGIDGSLGPGPVVPPPASAPSSPPATAPVKPRPKPLVCKRGWVKKKVKGKTRCVKRHKPKKHHRKHHLKPRKHPSR